MVHGLRTVSVSFPSSNESGDISCWVLGREEDFILCSHSAGREKCSRGIWRRGTRETKDKNCEDQHCMKWGLLIHLRPSPVLFSCSYLMGDREVAKEAFLGGTCRLMMTSICHCYRLTCYHLRPFTKKERSWEGGGYKQAEAYHNLMAYFTCFFFKERKTCIVLRMQMRKNVRASWGEKNRTGCWGTFLGHSHTITHAMPSQKSQLLFKILCSNTNVWCLWSSTQ